MTDFHMRSAGLIPQSHFRNKPCNDLAQQKPHQRTLHGIPIRANCNQRK